MKWGRLRQWWRRLGQRAGKTPVQQWQVVLYTRQGCHLCEDAWEQLQAWQQQQGFHLDVVDVDSDPALAAEHGLHVPVVSVNGRIRFRGRVPALLWQRLVRGAE